MEPNYQQTQNPPEDGGTKGGSGGGGGGGGYMCSRQTSSRWTPTTDQIRILKDLYYNNGVRSPSSEQIQRISARLRQYGKIEGKNVFYWFQNHKARERQKKRFTTSDVPVGSQPIIQRSGFGLNVNSNNSTSNIAAYDHSNNKFYPNISASAGVSASSGGVTAGGSGNFGHNFGSWVGHHADPYTSPYTIFDKRSNSKPVFADQENMIMEEDLYQDINYVQPEIETLPLFPVHAEDIHGGFGSIKSANEGYYSGWYRSDDGGGNGRTSLELSLNSYGHMTPGYFRSY